MMSRLDSFVFAPAHVFTGCENRLPFHHGGYFPVRWMAISADPIRVFPTRLAAMQARSRLSAPALCHSTCQSYGPPLPGASSFVLQYRFSSLR